VTAFVTYVAVDERAVPVAVPELELVSEDERALAAAATERREKRLARRRALDGGHG